MTNATPAKLEGAAHETPPSQAVNLVGMSQAQAGAHGDTACVDNLEARVNISLPMPPSTNNLFATVNGRRVVSRDYNMWRKTAYELLRLFKGKPIEKPYGVHIRLDLNHKSDIDNRVKPILDALVASETICGDQWVNTIRVDRDHSVNECQVEVWSLA